MTAKTPTQTPHESCRLCPFAYATWWLLRVTPRRFPYALRAAALFGLAVILAVVWNARLPLGIGWLPTPDKRVGIPRVYEGNLGEINAAQALQLYESTSALFVDSRDAKDFKQNHIPGAINLPQREWRTVWPKMKPTLSQDRMLVLYCYGAHCGLSTRQGKELLRKGWENFVILDYGWQIWTDHGYPTAKPLQKKGR